MTPERPRGAAGSGAKCWRRALHREKTDLDKDQRLAEAKKDAANRATWSTVGDRHIPPRRPASGPSRGIQSFPAFGGIRHFGYSGVQRQKAWPERKRGRTCANRSMRFPPTGGSYRGALRLSGSPLGQSERYSRRPSSTPAKRVELTKEGNQRQARACAPSRKRPA